MTDLSALKQLAKKAMPGPWMTGTSDDHWRREVRDASGHGVAWCGSNPATKAHANAAYIAACSPEVILQLCEVVEKAREVIGWSPVLRHGTRPHLPMPQTPCAQRWRLWRGSR